MVTCFGIRPSTSHDVALRVGIPNGNRAHLPVVSNGHGPAIGGFDRWTTVPISAWLFPARPLRFEHFGEWCWLLYNYEKLEFYQGCWEQTRHRNPGMSSIQEKKYKLVISHHISSLWQFIPVVLNIPYLYMYIIIPITSCFISVTGFASSEPTHWDETLLMGNGRALTWLQGIWPKDMW